MEGNGVMKQEYIDRLMNGKTGDDAFKDFMLKLPDSLEVYIALQDIFNSTEENGMDWTVRQLQQIAKKYLSDDKELMQLIDADEKEFPYE